MESQTFAPYGYGIFFRALSDAFGRFLGAISQHCAESFPLGDFLHHCNNGFSVPPGQLDSIGILPGNQTLFIALHRHGDTASDPHGINAVPVADVIGLDHCLEIVVHQHSAERCQCLELRAVHLIFNGKRAVLLSDDRSTADGAGIAAVAAHFVFVHVAAIQVGYRGQRIQSAKLPILERSVTDRNQEADVAPGPGCRQRLGILVAPDKSKKLLHGFIKFFRIRSGDCLHAAGDRKRFQPLGAHDRSHAVARRNPSSLAYNAGQQRNGFSRGSNAGDLHPGIVERLQQRVLRLIGILSPELRGVLQFSSAVPD